MVEVMQKAEKASTVPRPSTQSDSITFDKVSSLEKVAILLDDWPLHPSPVMSVHFPSCPTPSFWSRPAAFKLASPAAAGGWGSQQLPCRFYTPKLPMPAVNPPYACSKRGLAQST